jgi:hypothetical protein
MGQGDNFDEQTYDRYMAARQPYLLMTIQTKNPIEIGDFVSGFTSVAAQYDKFIRQEHPDLTTEAKIYVKQVRRGSIIVELLPFVPYVMFGAESLTHIEHINAINEFVTTYRDKVSTYFGRANKKDEATRSDLKDFLGTVSAVANDVDGKASIQAAIFEDGKKKVKAAFKFTTKEAIRAVRNIEIRQRQLEHRHHADYERV